MSDRDSIDDDVVSAALTVEKSHSTADSCSSTDE